MASQVTVLANSTEYDRSPLTSAVGSHPQLGGLVHWLDRLLAWQIAVTRQSYGALADDEYRGLYVSDDEADLLSTGMPALPEELVEQRRVFDLERAEIDTRFAGEIDAPFTRIATHFHLTRFEQDILLLALAPELDLRYERLFAYIQDDVTRKRPTVELALRLLTPPGADRRAHRIAFAAEAPLLRHRLIDIYEDGQRHAPLLSRIMKVDDRIVTELIGQRTLDPLIAAYAVVSRPVRRFDDLVLPPALAAQLRRVIAGDDAFILALQGGYGSGRGAIAEALCAELDLPLLTVDLDRLRESDLLPEEGTRRITREALLQGAAMLWQGMGRLLDDQEPSAWRPAALAAMDAFPGRSFIPLEQSWEARGALRQRRFLRVTLPPPTFSERERLWQLRLNGDSPGEETLQSLASTFRLSGGQIRDAVAMARSLKSWSGEPLRPEHLYAACRSQSSGKLDSLAHKIKTTYTWDDIVLPPDHVGQLREICAQVRHRRTVLETWGFDRHLAMGKGLNVLFSGQSGTGKTMAAEIIATDLGLELYKVDLSTLVSKYIGETEKNLDRIFTAAREANAILFFDEADSIFGKRSEVKDAHDRYANIEVGYLLQKMEEYDGVVILATNLRKNIDDAFVRRLHMTIDFPFPEEEDRLRIWRKVFPPEAPLGDSVDLSFLAQQFKVAGGNIRNIALLSAFLAAEEGKTIEMIHLMRALKREYQKLGKLVTRTDFGDYLPLVRAG